MQLAWNDILQQIADRIREPEDIAGPIPTGEVDIPYYDKTIIEPSLLEISQQLLREIPEEELEDIGSPAVETDVLDISSALPANLVKIASVAIQISPTDPKFYPSQPLPIGAWMQTSQVPVADALTWTAMGANLIFTGYQAKAVMIVEPPLAAWQAGEILPDGYDDVRIDWCVKQLRQMNNMPTGVI